MKKIILFAFSVLILMSSCKKHDLKFEMKPVDENAAEVQIHYMEPVTAAAANYIDSVYINDVLVSSANGSGSLATYNGVPCGAVGRFFVAKVGTNNIKFMRKGAVVYNQDVTLAAGKQNVIVHNLNQAPIVIDNEFPYWNRTAPATGANWNSDSVCKIMFINLLYETPTTPYPGTLQYQGVRQGENGVYFNVGGPVAFGQTTGRVEVILHKSVFNSSGYQRIDYRILNENGEIMQKWNGSKMVNYTDYWNGYIGRVYMHFFRGVRTANPQCNVSQWTSL